MTKLCLPDKKDIKGVILDYLTTVSPSEKSPDERKKIIDNCAKLFSTLIDAWELAESLGETEKLILAAFMHDIAVSRQQSRVKFKALYYREVFTGASIFYGRTQ